MRTNVLKSFFFKCFTVAILLLSTSKFYAQLPDKVLVGYHENWRTMKLSEIHPNYNVIQLAFALPKSGSTCDMFYTLPAGYSSISQMITDIDALHAQGKKVLLSIGGATAYIMLNNSAERDIFINSINNILASFQYKIDGIDLDLEKHMNTGQNSMAFGSWTMSSPAVGQTNMVNAVKAIMTNYQTQTGKKMLLTAAPEAVYLLGGLSSWQVANANGGAFLPILEGLRNEMDLLHMQLYNAGGASGGIVAWNGSIYYDNGGIDFALALNESIIKGFTMLSGKGSFSGWPASKLAFGLPASSGPTAAGTGYVTPTNVCNAARYFKGEIAKPSGVNYTMTAAYPTFKGLMTWSINEDSYATDGVYSFAQNFTCAFPVTAAVPVADFTINNSTVCVGQTVTFTDASTNSPTSWSWNFGSGASLATASSKGPHNITYSTTGIKTITLTVSNSTGTSTPVSKTINVIASVGNAGVIIGNSNVYENSTQTYSISSVNNATNYQWTIPSSATIISGQGTNNITVKFGTQSGNISVQPKNGCSVGSTSTLNITVTKDFSSCDNFTIWKTGTWFSVGTYVNHNNKVWQSLKRNRNSEPTLSNSNWKFESECGITQVNQAPTVSVTSPSNNSSFASGSAVTISASASDVDGQISKVEFLLNGNKIGEDLTSPYTFTTAALTAGNYTITAKATDNNGATTTSSTVNIVINQPVVNQAPTVSVTSPINNASFASGSAVTISASASDADGQINKVEFLLNGNKIGEDLTSPYTFTTAALTAGNYTITAKATDNNGATTTSSTVNIVINQPVVNQAPTVNVTSPSNNASFASGSAVTISASASDTDGQISKVEFLLNGNKIGEDLTSPYTFTTAALTAGNYTITAKATDNNGATTTSSTVNIVINQPVVNQAPTVNVTSPSNNASFASGSAVTISASASDADGQISKVEFLLNGNKIGEDLTSPYTFTTAALTAGNYTITAKATDNNGATTTSSTVNIVINQQQTSSCSTPSYVHGNIYVGGNEVSYEGKKWRAKWWTQNEYPGTSAVWEDLGACGDGSSIPVNQLPVVNIVTPTNNQSLTTENSVSVSVESSDLDGSITKVELFLNGSKVNESNLNNISFNLGTLLAGNYTIFAKATDNQGATSNSSNINFTITTVSTGGGSCNAPNYIEGTSYQSGESVQNANNLYTCMVAGWCSSSAWAYEPGVGLYWSQAWTLAGECISATPKLNLMVMNTSEQTVLEIESTEEEDLDIRVYNSSGQLVYVAKEKSFSNSTINHIIQKSNWSSGMYIVRVTGNNKFVQQKIIK
jgi:chitinase